MTAIERQKKYMDWILDLERRLAQFLFENPEGEKKEGVSVYSGSALPKAETYGASKDHEEQETKTTVEVRDLGSKWWAVLRNGKEVASFFGDGAQQRASKLASDLLNQEHIE